MKVYIYTIEREVNEGFIVRFHSSFGDGIATYVGKKPTEKMEYFVEIDVEGIFRWGEDILMIENSQYKIEVMGELVLICGMLESLDEDGYTVLRLGQSIVPIETAGSPYPIGSYIKIQSPNVKLYEIGL